MSVESFPSSGDARSPERAGVPATPSVSPEELWEGSPNVLVGEGRYLIGWLGRPKKKGGPVFVIVRQGMFDSRKIVERYPMTDDGWSKAWRAFIRLDPATADKVVAVLARRAEKERFLAARRDLGVRSLSFLSPVVFVGGHLSGTRPCSPTTPGFCCRVASARSARPGHRSPARRTAQAGPASYRWSMS